MQPPYTTGTASVTAGSAVVNGTNTAWTLGLVSGGLFTRLGLAVPILSVQSNTQLTLAYPWHGATGSGAYAIDLGRADAASAIVANRRLAEFLTAIGTISPFGTQLTAAENAAAVRVLIEALSSAAGAVGTANVADNAMTMAKLQDIASQTILGRATAGTGDPQALSAAQVKALLAIALSDVSGLTAALADRLTLAGGSMTGPITLARATAKNFIALPVNFVNESGLYYGNFSGVLSITEHNNGNTAIFICGAGVVVMLGQTGTSFQTGIPASGGPSRVGCFHDPNSNGYAFWNRRGGPVQVSVVAIEQRPAA